MSNGSLITDAKGRFAETIVSTLLEYAGYRVIRLGVEEVVSEVKASTARNEHTLQLPKQLSTAPDFLVVDPATGVTILLEVKFRAKFDDRVTASLHKILTQQAKYWPGTVSVFVCADHNENSTSNHIRNHIGCLRESDLERLIEPHEKLSKWQRLRTLGGIFERVAEEQFYQEAKSLVTPIRSWS